MASIDRKIREAGGEIIRDKDGKRVVFDAAEKLKLRNMKANADLNGIVEKVAKSRLDDEELMFQLEKLLSVYSEISSHDSMKRKGRIELLSKARKAVNLFLSEGHRVTDKAAKALFTDNFEKLTGALRLFTPVQKDFTVPDWKAYRAALIDPKFSTLDYYVNRSAFLIERRMTLFDVYQKQHVEADLAEYVLKNMEKIPHYDMIDNLMKRLDREYPAGSIKIPTVKVRPDGTTVAFDRKMSLDYYIKVWISDIEGTVHAAATESAYRQSGIDLVEIRSSSEDDCPLCAEIDKKVFSLSGDDPDFPLMNFALPLHPHCDHYMVPILDAGL